MINMPSSNPSNIAIRSNIWIDSEQPDRTTQWQASKQIPGDLMIDFLASENPLCNPREQRVINSSLTPKQIEEYHIRKFFLNHGECGAAYEE